VITNRLVITVKWGHFKPSQPPRRVGEWAKSGRHDDLDTPSQVGPLQTVTVGPTQAVTASLWAWPATLLVRSRLIRLSN
jgi:hypothetical protein